MYTIYSYFCVDDRFFSYNGEPSSHNCFYISAKNAKPVTSSICEALHECIN